MIAAALSAGERPHRERLWFWAELDGDGEPAYSGHPDLCIDCHARGSDDVRAFKLP